MMGPGKNNREKGETPPENHTGPVFGLFNIRSDNTMIDMNLASDRAVGARYRACRMLSGLTLEEVADRATQSPNMTNGHIITAAEVQGLEENPNKCALWLHAAVATALKKEIPDFPLGAVP